MSYLTFPTFEAAKRRSALQAFERGCQHPVTHWWPDAIEINGVWYMDVSYGSDDGGVWLTDEEKLRVINILPSEGAYYRRSLEVDADGNYTIESNLNPVLQDGTILTKDNHEQYDGAEGWQWYDSGEVVDIKVTPTRWESVKNWFSGIF